MRSAFDWKMQPGPWNLEPNRIAFEHAGFQCIILRAPRGHLCGYVAVPPGHPWHERDYRDIDVEVHGGLTFVSHCQGDPESGICHVAKPGEPDNVWWVGFDCAHIDDISPGYFMQPDPTWDEATYKDVAWVRAETCRLADQAVQAVVEIFA